jgi:cell division septum initiation protein DivIVA
MPSSSDFYNRLGEVRDKLTDVNNKLQKIDQNTDQLEAKLTQVNTTLQNGFSQLVTIGNYTNQALYQNSRQNETIICILEHISRNTCALVNESVKQTAHQAAIRESTRLLADLYAATHADAALQAQKLAALQRQIEECCPPPRPEPPCRYEKCEEPERLPQPPRAQTAPRRPEG